MDHGNWMMIPQDRPLHLSAADQPLARLFDVAPLLLQPVHRVDDAKARPCSIQ